MTRSTLRIGNLSGVSPLVIPRTLEVLSFVGDRVSEVVKSVQNQIDSWNTRLKSSVNVIEAREVGATERYIQNIFKKRSNKEASKVMNEVCVAADVVFSTLNGSDIMTFIKVNIIHIHSTYFYIF